MSRKIYLDFNASTPICPEAVEATRRGNGSGCRRYGPCEPGSGKG